MDEAPPENLQPLSLQTIAFVQAARLARLAPTHSYWDYLPYWMQTQIMKMAHKKLWTRVNVELLGLFYCPVCPRPFGRRLAWQCSPAIIDRIARSLWRASILRGENRDVDDNAQGFRS